MSIQISFKTIFILNKKGLIRFSNINNLIFGNIGNFNNSIIKEMIGSLNSLQFLDISNIQKIDDRSIVRLLFKANNLNIISLKLNPFIESLHIALCYCLNYYKNLNELGIVNNNFNINQNYLHTLSKQNKHYKKEVYKTIGKLLKSKSHNIKRLELFIFNTQSKNTSISLN